MLQAVSDVVLRNVESVFPYDPTTEHMVSLVVSKEFAPMMDRATQGRLRQAARHPGSRNHRPAGQGVALNGAPPRLVGRRRRSVQARALHVLPRVPAHGLADHRRHPGQLAAAPRRPCAHITHGVATAINAGTAAYFLGEGITRDHPNLTDQQRLRVYELYFTCLRGAHVGQAVDLNGVGHMMESCLSTNDFSPMWETLLCCHRLKSGLPASICARTGAVLGHASVEQEAALGEYFLSMGLAFQIIDDVINLRGFGKSLKTTAEDLIEGKITAPVIRCLMHLRGEPERQRWLWRQYALGQAERDYGGWSR